MRRRRPNDIVSRTINIATDTFYFDDPYHSLRELDAPLEVGRTHFNQTLKKYLSGDHLVLTVLPSAGEADATLPKRPADAAPVAPKLPTSEVFTLDNGIPVTYWKVGEFGTSYLQLVASQGSASEKLPGSTALLSSLLDRGFPDKRFRSRHRSGRRKRVVRATRPRS